GLVLKETLKPVIAGLGFNVTDLGTHTEETVDYPDFGRRVAQEIETGRIDKAVIICGTGIGISIAANRNRAARAALCHDVYTAEMARKHNDANILALGARVLSDKMAKEITTAFLTTEFEGG